MYASNASALDCTSDDADEFLDTLFAAVKTFLGGNLGSPPLEELVEVSTTVEDKASHSVLTSSSAAANLIAAAPPASPAADASPAVVAKDVAVVDSCTAAAASSSPALPLPPTPLLLLLLFNLCSFNLAEASAVSCLA